MALNKRMGDLHYMLGRHFFTQRIEKYWHKLSREVVYALSLETFKVRLDRALSNLTEM